MSATVVEAARQGWETRVTVALEGVEAQEDQWSRSCAPRSSSCVTRSRCSVRVRTGLRRCWSSSRVEGSRLGGVTLRRRRRNMDYYSMSYDVMRETAVRAATPKQQGFQHQHENPDHGIER